MELRAYWAILRRRWAAPVLLPILVALFSAVQLRPWQAPAPSYSVSLRMLVGVLPLEGVDTAQYDPRYYAWMASEYLVDDFTEVLAAELFAKAVNARLAEQEDSHPGRIDPGNRQHRQTASHHPAHLHLARCRCIARHRRRSSCRVGGKRRLIFCPVGNARRRRPHSGLANRSSRRPEYSRTGRMAVENSSGAGRRHCRGVLAGIPRRYRAPSRGIGGNGPAHTRRNSQTTRQIADKRIIECGPFCRSSTC